MASVKIFLEPNESIQDAEEQLLKALSNQADGVHDEATFHQPAARHVLDRMNVEFDETWEVILREIAEVLDEDLQ